MPQSRDETYGNHAPRPEPTPQGLNPNLAGVTEKRFGPSGVGGFLKEFPLVRWFHPSADD
jgi:hypothetical protein